MAMASQCMHLSKWIQQRYLLYFNCTSIKLLKEKKNSGM